MEEHFYNHALYPFQDELIKIINQVELGRARNPGYECQRGLALENPAPAFVGDAGLVAVAKIVSFLWRFFIFLKKRHHA